MNQQATTPEDQTETSHEENPIQAQEETNGVEETPMEEMGLDDATEAVYGRPDFIQPDPHDPSVFECSHHEATGRFKMGKPDIEMQIRCMDIHERYLKPSGEQNVSEARSALVEWLSVLSVAFTGAPDGFNPKRLTSSTLVRSLYAEVMAYWATFQD